MGTGRSREAGVSVQHGGCPSSSEHAGSCSLVGSVSLPGIRGTEYRAEHIQPVQDEERIGLWTRTSLRRLSLRMPSMYIGIPSTNGLPTGEQLDLDIDLPAKKDFAWSSGMESAVQVDEANKIWRVEVRIPWTAFGARSPLRETGGAGNFFRCDRANNAYLAFSPTLKGTFHAPGLLRMAGVCRVTSQAQVPQIVFTNAQFGVRVSATTLRNCAVHLLGMNSY